MNVPTEPWQMAFEAFAGPGIRYPSAMMRVTDDDAREILAALGDGGWAEPDHVGTGRHAGYTIRQAPKMVATALFCADARVGFYVGSYIWIATSHRGLGLSIPLILAAARQRGGSILPPGIVVQGYTPASLAAHRAAHTHSVLTAVAEGLPVPAAVLDALRCGDRWRPMAAIAST